MGSLGPFALSWKARKFSSDPGLTAKTIPDLQSLPKMFALDQRAWKTSRRWNLLITSRVKPPLVFLTGLESYRAIACDVYSAGHGRARDMISRFSYTLSRYIVETRDGSNSELAYMKNALRTARVERGGTYTEGRTKELTIRTEYYPGPGRNRKCWYPKNVSQRKW